jgi:pSer/pThr/pTyr-binding forkhead associated (FHA) protein
MGQDMNEATRVMGAAGTPPDDKTMVAGTMPSDRTMVAGAPPMAGATQMGQTVVCVICRTTNSGLETYCGECGFLLASTPGSAAEAPAEEALSLELVENTTGRKFRLKSGVNTVGRETSDILLMDSTVSRRHAQVTVENGSVSVTDNGSTNGSMVDGVRLGPNQPTPVPPGSTVRFGNATLTLSGGAPAEATSVITPPAEVTVQVGAAPDANYDQTLIGVPGEAPSTPVAPAATDTGIPEAAPEPAAASAPAAVARLTPTSPGAPEIEIREGVITIGRRAGNDVVISTDNYVSGSHARVDCDSTGCYLTDLGSTNGTTVNGVRLAPNAKQALLDGDGVSLGQTAYVFETILPETPGTESLEFSTEEEPAAHDAGAEPHVEGGHE